MFLLKIYDKAVIDMKELLKSRNVCLYSQKSHEKCYSEFRTYLISENKHYLFYKAKNG